MTYTIALDQVQPEDRDRIGGKGYALSVMAGKGLRIPNAMIITVAAYKEYLARTGIGESIALEINRKIIEQLRWEELWDAALRIRNLFLRTPLPGELEASLARDIESKFAGRAVVVRSSAPGEDSANVSFAGLHESYVNIRGTEAILDHVRLVWASLWSDAALLYRKELGLDIATSSMAVIIQELVTGNRSGVAFSQSPENPSQAVIEAVHGFNQGLVDGTIEPDRWILDRKTAAILSHHPADRQQAIFAGPSGVELRILPADVAARPPLSPPEVKTVFKMTRKAEELFGSPQDMEWTLCKRALFILQSRPITTGEPAEGDDKRSWYLSLRRSFENLKALLTEVEGKWIPAMIAEGDELSRADLSALSDADLAGEIERRQAIHKKWSEVYETYFIPLAHGIRLFGQTYNDALRPVDPYEFMDLLGGTELISVDRNRLLARMAEMVRGNQALERTLREGVFTEKDRVFDAVLEEFARRYGDLGCGTDRCFQGNDALFALILRMAAAPAVRERFSHAGIEERREAYLSRFVGGARNRAVEILDLGRASYRLRDNDNIHLGRIEGALLAAIEEGKHRLEGRMGPAVHGLQPGDTAQALRDPHFLPHSEMPAKEEIAGAEEITVRQIRGQPAGPGVARGQARVIVVHADLLDIRAGEILVCDAIDPNMTFAVPLAAGIVERRGGMLIHGAIIAREYGIPCVTGVPRAVEMIKTGDQLIVDGYLGIVTIEKSSDL